MILFVLLVMRVPYYTMAMFFGKVLRFARSYVVGNNVKGHSIWLGFRGNDGVELSEKLTEGCRYSLIFGR